jgi:hypothetical protein
MGASTSVDSRTLLSDPLQPDMGTCHWAACTELGRCRMTFYEDLSDYTYTESDVPMINVGWLGEGQDFQIGTTGDGARDILVKMAENPMNLMRGSHSCDFCSEDSPLRFTAPGTSFGKVSLGNGEIHVQGSGGVIYSCPTLIIHYIDRHKYRPPAVFIQAVLSTGSRYGE